MLGSTMQTKLVLLALLLLAFLHHIMCINEVLDPLSLLKNDAMISEQNLNHRLSRSQSHEKLNDMNGISTVSKEKYFLHSTTHTNKQVPKYTSIPLFEQVIAYKAKVFDEVILNLCKNNSSHLNKLLEELSVAPQERRLDTLKLKIITSIKKLNNIYTPNYELTFKGFVELVKPSSILSQGNYLIGINEALMKFVYVLAEYGEVEGYLDKYLGRLDLNTIRTVKLSSKFIEWRKNNDNMIKDLDKLHEFSLMLVRKHTVGNKFDILLANYHSEYNWYSPLFITTYEIRKLIPRYGIQYELLKYKYFHIVKDADDFRIDLKRD